MVEALARYWWAIWLAGLLVGARLVATLRSAERLARSGTWTPCATRRLAGHGQRARGWRWSARCWC